MARSQDLRRARCVGQRLLRLAGSHTFGPLTGGRGTPGAGFSGSGLDRGPGADARTGGRIALRTHTAAIDVEHTTKSYTIKYRDSQNLDARDGMIHRNYNGWIQNLDKAIRSELTLL